MVDNKSLLSLLPCRSKGGTSQYPQFVLRLWRNLEHIATHSPMYDVDIDKYALLE